MSAERRELLAEVERLQGWVNDLQSGMYINCVYCGHCYGPCEDTSVSMRDVLQKHVEQCPQHPLSAAKAQIDRLLAENLAFRHYCGSIWLERDGEGNWKHAPVLVYFSGGRTK